MLRRIRESRHIDIEKLEIVISRLQEANVPEDQYRHLVELDEKFKRSVNMK